MLRRTRDDADARAVRLTLTELSEDRIARQTERHLAEPTRLAPLLHLPTDMPG